MAPKTLLKECAGRLRVLAFTAIRSEYDLLYPVLDAMRRDPAFDLRVVVAGAHLTALHRHSVRFIERDGLRVVARIRNLRLGARSNTTAGRVEAAAALLGGMARVLERQRPDLLLFLGDREEPLAAATAALYMGVPSVHMAGGDSAAPAGGDVDEEARHATTKLSHVHLTMAGAHARRILRLGEEAWRVKTVGNPGLDRLRLEPRIAPERLRRAVGEAAARDYVVLIYHAMSSEARQAPSELELCLKECLATGLEVFVGAPNSDPGYEDLRKVLRRHSRHQRVHLYQNLPRSEFAALLRGAKAVVGNSSLGLLEASYIGLPCVNVGQRQRGRLAGINAQFVDAKPDPLRRALRRALFDPRYRAAVRRGKSPYGDGHAAGRALRFLKNLPPKARLLAKKITY